jgi:outer membrane protein assembly factor BamD
MKTRLSLLLLALSLLIGCASTDELDENAAAAEIYAQGKDALIGRDYTRAIELYSELESRFPFGVYTQQAILDTAYAQYKNGEPDLAITAADRFIKLYPRHGQVDYAHYLKGLANFNRGDNFIERLMPTDRSIREQKSVQQAYNDFTTLVEKYPQSKYTTDAKQRISYLQNLMARYELNVAQYYFKRKAYVAAANRAKFVIESYPMSKQRKSALEIMQKSYAKLGMDDLANDTKRVLELNYSNKN